MINVGCAQLPPKPKGELCTPLFRVNVPEWSKTYTICSDIRRPSNKYKMPLRSMGVMVTHQTWNEIMDYIKRLKEIAQRRCQ